MKKSCYVEGDERGFTLIEVMIVIAIIAILAAVAIPQFTTYRTRSLNSSAKADLRNAAGAQEAYHVDNRTYCSSVANLTGETYGLYLSEGISLTIKGATADSYSMVTFHPAGNVSYFLTGPGGAITP
jgi:prepilin-type N-terminal cleavage/methylation domain-containing protein